ncbi:MAG: toll/interleukin-1 receptor domain-containing protein [Syntrophaceae bacterium]|nr:toll/interleukin-1 receptor domain-containing protein [Syntrophaceae bacterium]
MNRPLVFISYAGDELDLADFVKNFLLRVSGNKIEVFVAKRDISSGADPLKTMLNEKLRNADAIIPICSYKSKDTPWLWWESASVWAKTGKVHPLFTNISANVFGGPLILVVQGKEFFTKQEFFQTIDALCKNVNITVTQLDFTEEEAVRYTELEKASSVYTHPASIKIDYKIIEQTQLYHKYSLIFEIQNKSEIAFDDIVLDIFFPTEYLIIKNWNYPFLASSLPTDKPGYTCLTFIFNNISEKAKQKFSQFLLPEKILKIFGVDEGRINSLEYEMDNNRWGSRYKYKISYNLYINKKAPQRGSIDFSTLQFF